MNTKRRPKSPRIKKTLTADQDYQASRNCYQIALQIENGEKAVHDVAHQMKIAMNKGVEANPFKFVRALLREYDIHNLTVPTLRAAAYYITGDHIKDMTYGRDRVINASDKTILERE